MNRRKRRGSVTQVPYEELVLPPEAIRMGVWDFVPDRYCTLRPGKLSADQQGTVRLAIARGRSLREVAVDFGVSHETVRAVVRRPATRGMGV